MDITTTNQLLNIVGTVCGGVTCLGVIVITLFVIACCRLSADIDNALGER